MVDRLGAMAEKEERKSGPPSKVEQLTVCALRGFGLHKVMMGTNTYGPELESCLRRQARSERDRLWHAKLRIPITNRIAKAASSGLFGNVASEGTDEITVTLGDCIAMDASRYRPHRWDGEKIEPANKEPQTMACFIGAAKHQIKLFCLLYGEEHKRERKKALKHLIWLRDQKPELPTVTFLVESWNRICYEYTEAVREGVRVILRALTEGGTRDSFSPYALSPYRNSTKR